MKQRYVQLSQDQGTMTGELSESSGKKTTKYNVDKTREMQRLGENSWWRPQKRTEGRRFFLSTT